jgi:hypothetical protein
MSYNPALRRPYVRPQAGVTKTRKVLRDGSVEILRVSTDDRGVVRKERTVVVPCSKHGG